MREFIVKHLLVTFVALAVLLPAPAIGAPQHDQHHPQAQTTPGDQGKGKGPMMMGQMKMQGAMDEMAAKKKANTDRINALMARVNASRGDEKAAAMADVIAILVEERAAMQEHCAAMHGKMDK